MHCYIKSILDNGCRTNPIDHPEYERYLEGAFTGDQRLLARDLGTDARKSGSARQIIGDAKRGDHVSDPEPNYCGVSVLEATGCARPVILFDCRDEAGETICYHEASATKEGLKICPDVYQPVAGTLRHYGAVANVFLRDYKPRDAAHDYADCRQDYREDGIRLTCDFIQSLEDGKGLTKAITRSYTEGIKRRFYNEYPGDTTQVMYGDEAMPPVVQLMTVDHQVQNSYANLMDPLYIVWYLLVAQANPSLTRELMLLAFHKCRDASIDHILSVTASFVRSFAKHAPGTLSRMARDNNMFIGPEYIHDINMLVPWTMETSNMDILAEVVTYMSRWQAICGHQRIKIKEQYGTTDLRFNLDAYIQGNFLGGERTMMTVPVHFNQKQLLRLINRPLTPKDIHVIRSSLAPSTGTCVSTFRKQTMSLDLAVLVAKLAQVLAGLKDSHFREKPELVGTCVMQILYLIKNGHFAEDSLDSDVSQMIRFVSVVLDAGCNSVETIVYFAAVQMKEFASTAILRSSEKIKTSSPYIQTYQRSAKILSLLKDGQTLPGVLSPDSALEAILKPLFGTQNAHVQHWVPCGETSPSLNSAIRSRILYQEGKRSRQSEDSKSMKAQVTSRRYQTKYLRISDYSME